ncbi:MAG: thioredoxin domain-containing protein [Candidatus Nanohaloarchaea archaeon]
MEHGFNKLLIVCVRVLHINAGEIRMSDVTVEVFYTDSCPNCPAQKELAREFEDEAKVKMTNVSRNQGRADNHNVRGVPTTVLSGPGLEQKMGFTGVMKEEKLETAIQVAKGEADPDELKSGSLGKKVKEALPF